VVLRKGALLLALALVAGCGTAREGTADRPTADDPGLIVFEGEDGYLRAIRPDGTGMRPFKLRVPCVTPIDFSADGRIVVCVGSGPRGRPPVYLMKRDGSDGRRVWLPAGTYPMDVSLSPDGSKLVVSNTITAESSELWEVPTDGQAAQRLVVGGWNDYPRWSPDGEEIAFFRDAELYECATGEFGTGELVVMDVKARHQRAIARGIEALRWSPDSKSIAFVDNCDNTIWSVSADGGPAKVLAHLPYTPVLAWSPDGKNVVFFRQEDPCSDGVKRGYEEPPSECERIVVVPATGGEPRAIGNIAVSASRVFWLPSAAASPSAVSATTP
jgi:Tol biopolymer transport system component